MWCVCVCTSVSVCVYVHPSINPSIHASIRTAIHTYIHFAHAHTHIHNMYLYMYIIVYTNIRMIAKQICLQVCNEQTIHMYFVHMRASKKHWISPYLDKFVCRIEVGLPSSNKNSIEMGFWTSRTHGCCNKTYYWACDTAWSTDLSWNTRPRDNGSQSEFHVRRILYRLK